MALLSRLSGAIWNFVSPVKTAAQPERQQAVVPPRQSSLATLQRHKSMSPTSRVASWQLHSPGTSIEYTSRTSITSPTLVVSSKRKRTASPADEKPIKRGRGRPPKPKTVATATDKKRGRGPPRKTTTPAKKKMDVMDMDYEGSTLLEENDISSLMSEIHVASPPPPLPKPTTAQTPSWTSNDAEDPTLLSPVTPARFPSVDRPPSPALTTTGATPAAQLPLRDLTAFPLSTQPLVRHLLLRGREPLFPSTWSKDFRFLPTSLFFPSLLDDAVISSVRGADFRAQKAFEDLLALGSRVRDKILVKRDPESAAVRGVENFAAWAGKDVALRGREGMCPDLLVVASGDKKTDVDVLQRDLAGKMARCEAEWNTWLGGGEVPVIYGVVVSHTVLAMVGYEAGEGGEGQGVERVMEGMKMIGTFDFGVRGLDVWNALAVALLVVHVRDVMRGYAV
ncbi:hypothetical protein CAC42_5365 [Sphaceloma murrayae]|uniref:Uncharacterized protein n=1 Tax=Sphaceloma murrayae TaxID=2082308 RepID=A0A2K1QUT3_9PEZI|nr:hypothetical protein CAC42_5365 [Sphaceloma murrayae]